MAGNKSDNGVHEIGTNDILASYKADTPGEIETKYLENVNEYIKKGKEKQKQQVKASFAMIFDNPLQGYPYNEQYGMDKTLEENEESIEEGQFWGQDKWAKSIDKKLKKTHVRLVKDGKGGMSRATLSKKDKKKIAQLKKDGYKEVPIEELDLEGVK